jgi:hypothetical protein
VNYARLFAKALSKAPYDLDVTVTNGACSGATTDHFFEAQHLFAPRQDALVNDSYNLILLTITGNDAKFASIVQQCLIEASDKGTDCDSALTFAEQMEKGTPTGSTIGKSLIKVLTAIHAKTAKNAKIALLGYPFLIGNSDYTIPKFHDGRKPVVEVGARLHALSAKSEQIDAAVVAALNKKNSDKPFVFISTQDLFKGHGLYPGKNNAANAQAWLVKPLHTVKVATWYHPTPTGWIQESKLLVSRAADLGVPMPKPASGWPTGDLDGTSVLWAWFGLELATPDWVSCLDDMTYCIAGEGDDVHVIRYSGLEDIGHMPAKTKNPHGELVGFTSKQATELLRRN